MYSDYVFLGLEPLNSQIMSFTRLLGLKNVKNLKTGIFEKIDNLPVIS